MSMNHRIVVLTLLSILHAVLGVLYIMFLCFYGAGINSYVVDFIVGLIPVSFILFNRCVHLDFYDFVKGDTDDLPEYTRDGYIFAFIQKQLFGKEYLSKSNVDDYKGGPVNDISALCDIKDPILVKDIFNEKLQYVVTCCIITVIILSKYNLKRFIPFFILWFYYTFSS